MKKTAWAPAKVQMGRRKMVGCGCPGFGLSGRSMTSEDRQVLGIAILSALSIAGLHAAICPSWFTLASFAAQPEAQDRAMKGMYISLGVSTLASGGLYFVFEKWMPVIVAELTAVALFGIGVWAINSKPASTIPPIQSPQNQGVPAAQSPQAAAVPA